ncbi:transglutaminase-like domain-containing protein [Methanolobus halotolerans]|nr:transglutaminase family protein [Methanolobus halotolerans]
MSSLLTTGCVSGPIQDVRELLSPSTATLLQAETVYELDPLRLTVPVTPGQAPYTLENRPSASATYAPGFEVASSYFYYSGFYEGTEGVTSIHVKNLGDNTIFVYDFGLLRTINDEWHGQDTSITILPGEEKMIGHISFNIPENTEEITLKAGLSMMVRTSSGKWYDYQRQYFDEFTVEIEQQPMAQETPYIYNPVNIFEKVEGKITPYDIEVRKMAAVSAKKYPGQYNIYQLCSLFDDTRDNIQYISDPRGRDMWSTPRDTLRVGAGDCDDYAILLASLVESIGGTARIYMTDTHAFAAVYAGEVDNIENVIEAIQYYYGPLPVYYTSDEYGCWLMMDPTSSVYIGGLPGGTAPVEGGWTFLNTSQVTVIDIAPQDEE